MKTKHMKDTGGSAPSLAKWLYAINFLKFFLPLLLVLATVISRFLAIYVRSQKAFLNRWTAGSDRCHIGVAFYPEDCVDPVALVASADKALYKAKPSGRNRYDRFSESADESPSVAEG